MVKQNNLQRKVILRQGASSNFSANEKKFGNLSHVTATYMLKTVQLLYLEDYKIKFSN